MANIKIIDLPTGSPESTSFVEATQVDELAESGRSTVKLALNALGNFVAGQGASPLEYGDLDTESTTLIGAINELKAAIETQYPINEASGALANFNTKIAASLVSCKLAINAQQASGTPTPTNPLPISGFTDANILHCGKNLCDFSDSTITEASYVINNEPLFLPAGTYILSFDFSGTSNTASFRIDDNNGNAVFTTSKTMISGKNTVQITLSQMGYYMKLFSNATGAYSNFQIEKGSTETAYEAYSGSTIAVDWTDDAGTIYGGELDAMTGVLTVTYGITSLDDYTFNYSSTYNRFESTTAISGVKTPPNNNTKINGACSIFEIDTSNNTVSTNDNTIGVATNGKFQIRDLSLAGDVDALVTLLSGQKLVFELATPITYQLTPQQITASFVGVNNICHDANGDTDVKFKQDIQGYIDEQIASVSG